MLFYDTRTEIKTTKVAIINCVELYVVEEYDYSFKVIQLIYLKICSFMLRIKLWTNVCELRSTEYEFILILRQKKTSNNIGCKRLVLIIFKGV